MQCSLERGGLPRARGAEEKRQELVSVSAVAPGPAQDQVGEGPLRGVQGVQRHGRGRWPCGRRVSKQRSLVLLLARALVVLLLGPEPSQVLRRDDAKELLAPEALPLHEVVCWPQSVPLVLGALVGAVQGLRVLGQRDLVVLHAACPAAPLVARGGDATPVPDEVSLVLVVLRGALPGVVRDDGFTPCSQPCVDLRRSPRAGLAVREVDALAGPCDHGEAAFAEDAALVVLPELRSGLGRPQLTAHRLVLLAPGLEVLPARRRVHELVPGEALACLCHLGHARAPPDERNEVQGQDAQDQVLDQSRLGRRQRTLHAQSSELFLQSGFRGSGHAVPQRFAHGACIRADGSVPGEPVLPHLLDHGLPRGGDLFCRRGLVCLLHHPRRLPLRPLPSRRAGLPLTVVVLEALLHPPWASRALDEGLQLRQGLVFIEVHGVLARVLPGPQQPQGHSGMPGGGGLAEVQLQVGLHVEHPRPVHPTEARVVAVGLGGEAQEAHSWQLRMQTRVLAGDLEAVLVALNGRGLVEALRALGPWFVLPEHLLGHLDAREAVHIQPPEVPRPHRTRELPEDVPGLQGAEGLWH